MKYIDLSCHIGTQGSSKLGQVGYLYAPRNFVFIAAYSVCVSTKVVTSY